MAHDDRAPATLAELNSMLFVLPARDPFGTTPVDIHDDLQQLRTSQSQPVSWDNTLHVSISPSGVEFLDATYDWDTGLTSYASASIDPCPANMYGPSYPFIKREGVAKITALPFRKREPAEERAFGLIQQFAPFMATPQEARLFFLARDLDHLVNEAVMAQTAFPASIDEAAEWLGLALTNVVPVPETEAAVTVGFDGVQAYRYTVKFPGGAVYDAVTYWHKLGGTDGFGTTYPYAKFRDEVGRPFTTIGSFNLAN